MCNVARITQAINFAAGLKSGNEEETNSRKKRVTIHDGNTGL